MELPESGAKRTGAMLANGRVAAGLELTDIARETRVPLRHLKALEADNHADLPALPYAIGFVKAYARAIGLDPETVASQFRAETSKSAHVPTPASLEPLDERRLPSSTLVVISVAVVIGIIAGLSAWGAGAFDPPPPLVAEAPVTAAPEAIAPAADPAVDPAADPALAPPATTAAASPGEPMATSGTVVLTAKEDVWIKIYDGTTRESVKTGTLAAGESYTVPAQPGLQLWTGKAGALDVSIAGRPIPPLGGLVETVRNVSLEPAALVARQAARDAGAAPADAPSGTKPIATIPVPKPIATAPAPTPGT